MSELRAVTEVLLVEDDPGHILLNEKTLKDPQLGCISVAIPTTSAAKVDVEAAYDLHADAYVRRPAARSGSLTAARVIDSFLIAVATLPASASTGGAR